MATTLLTAFREFFRVAHRFFATLLRRVAQDQVLIMSAALAYYGFLAVIPLLLLGLVIGHYAVGSSDAFYEHVDVTLRGILPAESLQGLDQQALQTRAQQFTDWRSIIGASGLLALIWIGVRIFDVLERELSRIWRAPELRGWLSRKGVAFLAFLLAALLFMLSISATSLAAARGYGVTLFGVTLSDLSVPWNVLTAVTPVLLSVLMFMCLYTMLPNTRVSRRHALLGAVLAAAVWELWKATFQYCVSYFPTYDRLYGSLAGVTILVLWLNLTAFSLLLGAEVAAMCQEEESGGAQSAGPPD